MLDDMDDDDWHYWPQVMALDPQGPQMDGLYFGLVASLLYNANRDKNAKALGPQDFFPHLKTFQEKAPQSPRKMRMLMALQAWKMRGLTTGKPLAKGKASGTMNPPPE